MAPNSKAQNGQSPSKRREGANSNSSPKSKASGAANNTKGLTKQQSSLIMQVNAASIERNKSDNSSSTKKAAKTHNFPAMVSFSKDEPALDEL